MYNVQTSRAQELLKGNIPLGQQIMKRESTEFLSISGTITAGFLFLSATTYSIVLHLDLALNHEFKNIFKHLN